MKNRNVITVASGILLPAILFVIAIPILVQIYSVERFGYISLMWAFLSIASIFDVGLSRALTNFIASEKNVDNHISVYGALILTLVVAFLFCFLLYVTVFFIFGQSLHDFLDKRLGADLAREASDAIGIILLCIPLVVSFAVFRGALDGLEKYNVVSKVKIFTAVVTLLFLLGAYFLSPSLSFAGWAILASRLIGVVTLGWFVFMSIRFRFLRRIFRIKKIISYGGFASVSTVISAFLVYMDRFVAASFINPTMFSIYSMINDVIMRFSFVPGAISSVLFVTVSNKESSSSIVKAYLTLSVCIVPISIVIFIFGASLLTLWIGSDVDFSQYETVIRLILIGFIFNCFAHIPYAILQARGYVKLTAKIHLTEALIFIPLMIICAKSFGLLGILTAWVSRHIFDFIVLTTLMKVNK